MPVPDRNLTAAALLGAAAGLRTFTPAAVMAARNRLSSNPSVRAAVIVAAAGELVADKLPFVPARIEPGSYLGRIASGAFCGHTAAARTGALTAAGTSAVATLVGYRARRHASEKAGIPKLIAAALEDAVAIGCAALAMVIAD